MSAVPRRKVSAENVSHKINKSVTDLFNCTDEITSQQLAAHKKALVAKLNSMDEQATESHCHLPRHSFPRLCHCLHRGVQLVDSGAPRRWAGRCSVLRGLLLHADLRCIGRFDFGRSFRTNLKIPKRTAEPYVRKMLIKQNKWMKALDKG